MILALSSSGDLTTDYVVKAVERADAEIVRLNTNDLLTEWRFAVNTQSVLFWSQDRQVDPSSVEAVYYRRAFNPIPPAEASERSWVFIAREARVLQRALYASLKCPWISHHAAIRDAENKPRQLKMAAQLGFDVPDTLITNDAERAKAFVLEHARVVTKPLSYGDLGGGRVVHTTLLDGWSNEYGPEISVAPTLLQRYIDKSADLRVTVVDEKVFACRIHSQSNLRYAVDMRRGLSDDSMKHELIELSESHVRRCVALVRALGLRFGAVDLAEDRDRRLWFLEVNPNGQWAWIQDRTGAPIATAIAEALTRRD